VVREPPAKTSNVMHLTTPSNAISNFSLPGVLGKTPFVRHDFLEWDESAVDEALVALLMSKTGAGSGELTETKSQS